MPAICRLGDYETGHDLCPPVPCVTASPDCYVNGIAIHRLGDLWQTHGCKQHPSHQDSTIGASPNCFVNGIPIARVGDAVSNGASVRDGSPNCFVNGG